METKIFKFESEKSIREIISEIRTKSEKFGFVIRYDFNMGEVFEEHGVTVDDDFKFHSIQLCIPNKAYNSIKENSDRVTLIMPKNIVVYKDKISNKTIISYFSIGDDLLLKILPGDDKILNSLPKSSEIILELINLVK